MRPPPKIEPPRIEFPRHEGATGLGCPEGLEIRLRVVTEIHHLQEFGRKGINVVAIHPGATRTERTDPASEPALAAGTTIGRIVDASEIAWLVAVLASPRSRAINGVTIQAGGGQKSVIDY